MATKDYIPSSDSALLDFANNFFSTIGADASAFGLTGDDKTALQTLLASYGSSLAAHNTAQTTSKTARQTKDAERAAIVAILRSCARRVQVHPAVTDAQRATLGITIPDKIPTSITAPTTAPNLQIGTEQRLQHSLFFTDETSTTSGAKPNGVHGCAIWLKVSSTAPTGKSQMEFLGVYTRSPGKVVFEESQGGSQAWYLCEWQTRKGLAGPTSAMVSATIVK